MTALAAGSAVSDTDASHFRDMTALAAGPAVSDTDAAHFQTDALDPQAEQPQDGQMPQLVRRGRQQQGRKQGADVAVIHARNEKEKRNAYGQMITIHIENGTLLFLSVRLSYAFKAPDMKKPRIAPGLQKNLVSRFRGSGRCLNTAVRSKRCRAVRLRTPRWRGDPPHRWAAPHPPSPPRWVRR